MIDWTRVETWSWKRFSPPRLTSSELWGVVSLGVILLLFQLVRWLAL